MDVDHSSDNTQFAVIDDYEMRIEKLIQMAKKHPFFDIDEIIEEL